MQIHYLSHKEIKNLKAGLMGKKRAYSNNPKINSKSNNSLISKSFSEMYKQKKNIETGDTFENNIRENLINEFGWEKVLTKRHNYFRKIIIIDKAIIINAGSKINLKINGYIFLLHFNNNKNLIIYFGIRKRYVITISKKIKDKSLKIHGINFYFSEIKEIELDGFFKIPDFSLDKFNNKDLSIIHNNINKTKKYQYACLEIKLSMKKIGGLIRQLIKDKDYLETIFKNKNIIYIGFINSNNIDFLNMKKLSALKNIDSLIFGINKKDGLWMKRDMRKYIDWALVSDLKIVAKKSEMLEKQINVEIKEIKDEIAQLNKKLDFIINVLGVKNSEQDFINKK